MGRDNLFHRRKARREASLRRRQARRDSYDTVLIVCEGEKTEPNYFNELRNALKLNTANIVITGDTGGSSPMDVVNYGFAHYLEYDQTFCVFDKDRHTNYQAALERVRQKRLRKDHCLQVITSVPCFELWLLLHFRYTTRNFETGQGSICAQVIRELKRDLPDYAKGCRGVYAQLYNRLSTAIKHAKQLEEYCRQSNTDHPATKVHELVTYLRGLQRR